MKPYLLVIPLLLLAGCAQVPKDAFRLSETALEQRQIETRHFEDVEEESLLSASAGVIQDMGFQMEEAETELGVLIASKERDATSAGQVVANVLLALFAGTTQPMDKDQTIRVAIVSKSLYDGSKKVDDAFAVRATFQRVVRRTDGSKYVETLKDEELYQGFFSQLSKSVFIEGQKI